MDNGFYECRLVGTADDGTKAWARIAGKGDPGNRATVTFVCESALALATQADQLPGGTRPRRISDAGYRARRRSRGAVAQRRCYARLPNDSVKPHVPTLLDRATDVGSWADRERRVAQLLDRRTAARHRRRAVFLAAADPDQACVRVVAGPDHAARAAHGVRGAVLRRRGRVVAPQRRSQSGSLRATWCTW